ncbi:SDR family oxidoreductase [Pseudomonas syringae]|uniref:SDR family NAD(P)-dependent oxidoreductase n=1 Tax=Pseudomonas syringae TaxID=317 RepID=UPI000F5C6EC2|nr:SDR family oxidoreductase [Pseudomonas syringae]RRD10171.1 SDR family oxidoreductase [Pseudomonas syringae]
MGVIVITGGSRGIGASAAEHLARRGMGVILTYNANPEAAATVVERIAQAGGKAVALRLDVADVGGFEAFRASVRSVLQDVWAQFDGVFNVHLKGPFFLTQTLLPLMAENASIVNLTSATTRVATAGVAPYAAFKGGLEVLTRYMAAEFAGRRIRTNAVSPGAIRTELGGGLNDEFEAMLAAQTALGRVGEPQDVARVIAMLLSEEGGWINAQTIEVAGGYNI